MKNQKPRKNVFRNKKNKVPISEIKFMDTHETLFGFVNKFLS